MKYKVVFRKRFDVSGEEMDNPAALVDPPEGVVLAAQVVEQIEAPNAHVSGNWEAMGEDDGFLAFGTETWLYDVEDSRKDEFEFALRGSQVVLDYEAVEEQPAGT